MELGQTCNDVQMLWSNLYVLDCNTWTQSMSLCLNLTCSQKKKGACRCQEDSLHATEDLQDTRSLCMDDTEVSLCASQHQGTCMQEWGHTNSRALLQLQEALFREPYTLQKCTPNSYPSLLHSMLGALIQKGGTF